MMEFYVNLILRIMLHYGVNLLNLEMVFTFPISEKYLAFIFSNMEYKIYQLKREYLSKSVDVYLTEKPLPLNYYNLVYTNKINPCNNDILDELFGIFNTNQISVSDIIQINNKYYLCLPIGWKQLIE